MGAPSVLPLAEPGQIAVHAAVDADEIWDLLPPLKAAGPRRSSSCPSRGSCRDGRGDRRGRPCARRRRAARLGGAVRRRRGPARVGRRRTSSTSARCAAIRSLAAAVEAVHAAQRPAGHHRLADPGHRGRAALAARSTRSGSTSRRGARLVARDDRRAGAGRRRAADRRRHAPARRAPLLATARELGIDEVYAVGGAQAIAALAYGTETIAPVAKIVGPGNRCVTEAKLLVSAQRRDRSPRRSERGARDRRRDRRPGGVSPPTCLPRPSTGPTARRSSSRRAAASPTRCSRARMGGCGSRPSRRSRTRSQRANEFAPEHLELLVADPDALAGRRSATRAPSSSGTTAVLGDYAAGSNHVLPTGGLARGTGGLGLEAFLQAGAVRPRDPARGPRRRPRDGRDPGRSSRACRCTPAPSRCAR